MLELMINGGHIAMLAIMPQGSGIDWDMVVFKGLTIKGIYGGKYLRLGTRVNDGAIWITS